MSFDAGHFLIRSARDSIELLRISCPFRMLVCGCGGCRRCRHLFCSGERLQGPKPGHSRDSQEAAGKRVGGPSSNICPSQLAAQKAVHRCTAFSSLEWVSRLGRGDSTWPILQGGYAQSFESFTEFSSPPTVSAATSAKHGQGHANCKVDKAKGGSTFHLTEPTRRI